MNVAVTLVYNWFEQESVSMFFSFVKVCWKSCAKNWAKIRTKLFFELFSEDKFREEEEQCFFCRGSWLKIMMVLTPKLKTHLIACFKQNNIIPIFDNQPYFWLLEIEWNFISMRAYVDASSWPIVSRKFWYWIGWPRCIIDRWWLDPESGCRIALRIDGRLILGNCDRDRTATHLSVGLEICQKIYTTQFSGAKILHTENA